jgi:integrase
MTHSRAPKGTVTIRSNDNRLYLRWSWSLELGGNGKRYEIALGLPDTKANCSVADLQAKLIERDLVNRLFDPTLRKYRGDRTGVKLTVVELFEKFIESKTPYVYSSTLIKYRGMLTHVRKFFRTKLAIEVKEAEAIAFRDWLLHTEQLAPVTVKDKLFLASAAWEWGVEDGRLPKEHKNPWTRPCAVHKVPPKQKPKPFTIEEVRKIVQGFRLDSEYAYYGDFVEFFLGVGCRTGEAVALQWGHLSDDCSQVWIGQSVTVEGDRKATKTNRDRAFPLTPRLQKLLLARRPSHPAADESVFPSRRGKTMNPRNFAKRAWSRTLKKLGIDYRRPYISRHTNATISIFEFDENPASVAQRLGHDPRTLFRNYLGDNGKPNAPPDFLGDD